MVKEEEEGKEEEREEEREAEEDEQEVRELDWNSGLEEEAVSQLHVP